MRLSQAERQAIIDEIKTFLPIEFSGRLMLFGSRANDTAKGGDIDLALIINSGKNAENNLNQLKINDYKILAAIKMNPVIGDRKIDLKILST